MEQAIQQVEIPQDLQAYLDAGFKIFPIQPNSKVPYPGHSWKDMATNDPEEVRAYLARLPNSNWAMATGASSGVTVIDVDVKNDGFGNLIGAMGLSFEQPMQRVVTPSKGAHFYYQYTSELKQTVNLVPGVDVRNDGGYVVIPPSSGYSTDKWFNFNLLELPGVYYEIANTQEERHNPVVSGVEEGFIAEGGRNHYLTAVAGYLRKQNTPSEAIAASLSALNEEALSSPLASYEVSAIARSVGRYAPSPDEFDDGDIEEVASSVPVKASDLVKPMLDYLQDKELVKGEPTQFDALDFVLGGGKRLGEITCWHAEAKTGKNTFWHFLMHKWLKTGIPIGYASRELTPEEEVLPNILALEYRKDVWLEEVQGEDYTETLSTWPLYFASGYGYMPIEEIKKWVRALVKEGVQYFWIDHLHYCLSNPEEHQEASKFIKQLKTLAKKYKVHFDIIIQPNKLLDGQRLSKNTIKGGSAMGQTIDNLILMQRLHDIPNTTEITLIDTRSKLSRLGKFHVKYDPATFGFIEVDIVNG